MKAAVTCPVTVRGYRSDVALSSEWFCALLDTAPDVYFRSSLTAPRGFVYVSPSIAALTGRDPAEFYADRRLCLSLVGPSDRRLLRRALRPRRGGVTIKLSILNNGLAIPAEVRTVALVRQRRVVAIEGVARLVVSRTDGVPEKNDGQPLQQRLAALMVEVHDLLHRVLPAGKGAATANPPSTLHFGNLVLDVDRLSVTNAGQPVALTTREVLVLRYLLERTGRVVTRQQLLTEVWSYSYTGDDRTVDVHISRLRRKLPSLAGRLIAVRSIGYRLEPHEGAAAAARVANS